MKCLVTGGAGFIGSHLCEALVARGDDVVAIDNFDPFYSRDIKTMNLAGLVDDPRFELIEADVRDQPVAESILGGNRWDVVVHLAARAGVRASMIDPRGHIDNNVGGTATLLEAMRRTGCERLVFASSSSVYGDSERLPFRERDPVLTPCSPYALTKKAGEDLCQIYHQAYGLTVINLRFFSVYGPRQRPDMAIHAFTRRLLEGQAIPVFGDGSAKRDYTYVGDVVAGVLRAIDHVTRHAGFELVNLGAGEPTSLSELIQRLADATGNEATVELLPPPPGEVRGTWADIRRAEQLLGFQPETDLATGLAAFVEWYQHNILMLSR
ncbi:MAG: NAD-dependent epimerase/dehydratase family protein [Gemmatimonadota bacterium]